MNEIAMSAMKDGGLNPVATGAKIIAADVGEGLIHLKFLREPCCFEAKV